MQARAPLIPPPFLCSRLLSLIGCWFERPPEQLSALTSLRGLYLVRLGHGQQAGWMGSCLVLATSAEGSTAMHTGLQACVQG